MSDASWKRYEFTQSVDFQPWHWARRWPLRLWIKPRQVTFTITFRARHGEQVEVAGTQVETNYPGEISV